MLKSYITEMEEFCEGIEDEKLSFKEALDNLQQATQWLLNQDMTQANEVAAVCVPYLKLFGFTAAGYMLARSAQMAQDQVGQGHDAFITEKINTAHFYMTHILPQAIAQAKSVMSGAEFVIKAKF